jgi:hypothetical protein
MVDAMLPATKADVKKVLDAVTDAHRDQAKIGEDTQRRARAARPLLDAARRCSTLLDAARRRPHGLAAERRAKAQGTFSAAAAQARLEAAAASDGGAAAVTCAPGACHFFSCYGVHSAKAEERRAWRRRAPLAPHASTSRSFSSSPSA